MPLSPRVEYWIARALAAAAPGAGRARLSLLLEDGVGAPSERLLDLCHAAAAHARAEDLSTIADRVTVGPRTPNVWPGEHYRFLAGLVAALSPAVVVEIGTHQGLSALALAKRLPPGGSVHTFDVLPWERIAGQCLRPEDLRDGRVVPHTDDLTRADALERHRALLESAGLVFVDAAKDGRMERVLLERFETLRCAAPPVVVLDDVRLFNMLGVWRSVSRPRLDATTFGHWSGTGLVDWQPR